MSESINAIETFLPAGAAQPDLATRWRRLRIGGTLLTGSIMLALVILVAFHQFVNLLYRRLHARR